MRTVVGNFMNRLKLLNRREATEKSIGNVWIVVQNCPSGLDKRCKSVKWAEGGSCRV